MALVALVLLISLSLFAIIAWQNARSDLAAELIAARTGALQTTRAALQNRAVVSREAHDLRPLVATFDGNRHLTAELRDANDELLARSIAVLPTRSAPSWFAAAVQPEIASLRVDISGGRDEYLLLRPEPASDVAAVWASASNAVGVFAASALVGLLLIYWVIGRALAPLLDLSRGLSGIGAHGYRERLKEEGPPELHRLQRGFNAMADRLEEIDERNRLLEAQVLTIQDEERADIARDLHDEIGPHLFAAALDADMLSRGLGPSGDLALKDQVRSIQQGVSYMQRQVRDLIARLRPTRAAELGLEAAIRDLATFWQARQPDVSFTCELSDADQHVPEALRDVIYRVAQESVANALRHAATTAIALTVREEPGDVLVSVVSSGTVKPKNAQVPGLGLASMRERVHGVGGRLDINRASSGWTVAAHFPRAARQAAA